MFAPPSRTLMHAKSYDPGDPAHASTIPAMHLLFNDGSPQAYRCGQASGNERSCNPRCLIASNSCLFL